MGLNKNSPSYKLPKAFKKWIDFNGLSLLSPGAVAGVATWLSRWDLSFMYTAHCSHMPPTGQDARCIWVRAALRMWKGQGVESFRIPWISPYAAFIQPGWYWDWINYRQPRGSDIIDCPYDFMDHADRTIHALFHSFSPFPRYTTFNKIKVVFIGQANSQNYPELTIIFLRKPTVY